MPWIALDTAGGCRRRSYSHGHVRGLLPGGAGAEVSAQLGLLRCTGDTAHPGGGTHGRHTCAGGRGTAGDAHLSHSSSRWRPRHGALPHDCDRCRLRIAWKWAGTPGGNTRRPLGSWDCWALAALAAALRLGISRDGHKAAARHGLRSVGPRGGLKRHAGMRRCHSGEPIAILREGRCHNSPWRERACAGRDRSTLTGTGRNTPRSRGRAVQLLTHCTCGQRPTPIARGAGTDTL